MNQGSEDRAAAPGTALGEDTMELQLTETEQLLLAEAATMAPSPLPVADSPERFVVASSAGEYIHRRTARIDLICTITFAAALLGVSAAAIWHPTTAPRAPALAARSLTPTSRIPAAGDRASAAPAVRVQNPFDAAEVFQFPPGTSEASAYDAVAALLLERARERRGHGPGDTPAEGTDPDASGPRPDILVSRLAEAAP
ncbi:MAG: hypothetical protein JSR36_00920 [Proteobacteria bacterium]|nr:hypothetical protein [Pseudomonadota bacterium]